MFTTMVTVDAMVVRNNQQPTQFISYAAGLYI